MLPEQEARLISEGEEAKPLQEGATEDRSRESKGPWGVEDTIAFRVWEFQQHNREQVKPLLEPHDANIGDSIRIRNEAIQTLRSGQAFNGKWQHISLGGRLSDVDWRLG